MSISSESPATRRGSGLSSAPSALRSRNFVLFVTGWELNQVAGGLLYFALPLYVLLETGHPALMGTVLALAAVPQILLMPMGGVIADRIDKRRFLAGINLAAAVAVLIWLLTTGTLDVVPAAAVLLLAYLGLEALFSPVFEAAIPALVPEDQLVRANSITSVLGFMSAFGAPALGGVLLARSGLTLVLAVAVALFSLTAAIKWFTRIPGVTQPVSGPVVRTFVADLAEAARYVAKGDHGLGKVLLVDFLVTFALGPLQFVVLPSILVYAGLNSGQIGWATGITWGGAAIAVTAVGALAARATVRLMRPLVLLAAGAATATGLFFLADLGPAASAVVMIGGLIVTLGLVAAFGVLLYSFIGKRVPEHLVGKIFALSGVGSVVGIAAGNLAFGHLMERFADNRAAVILVAAAIIAAAAVAASTAKDASRSATDTSDASAPQATDPDPEKAAAP